MALNLTLALKLKPLLNVSLKSSTYTTKIVIINLMNKDVPKFLSYPGVNESAKIQWPCLVQAEKSKMASKMVTRNICNGLFDMNCYTGLMYNIQCSTLVTTPS